MIENIERDEIKLNDESIQNIQLSRPYCKLSLTQFNFKSKFYFYTFL